MKAFILLLFCLWLPSCRKSSPTPEIANVSTVKVHTARKESITAELDAFGAVSLRSKADITSVVEGTLKIINADEGDEVSQGSVLASLSNFQLENRMHQAASALSSSRAALELSRTKLHEGTRRVEARLLNMQKTQAQIRQKEKELKQLALKMENKKELLSLGGVTQEELDSLQLNYSAAETSLFSLKQDMAIERIGLRDEDILFYGYALPVNTEERITILKDINTRTLQAEVNVALAQVESAETELNSAKVLVDSLTLRSPFSGIVAARYLEQEERVKADTKVFTIFDSSDVDISFPVPESRGILLRRGMAVTASMDSLENSTFDAVIRQISPMIDPKSGNIMIKAALDNRNKIFRPGMFTRVHLRYGKSREAILIPETCVVNKSENQALIFLVINNRVFPKRIIPGEENQGRMEVIEGLIGGELIIDSPSAVLKEGEHVEIQFS